MELKEICYRVRGCIKPCDDGGWSRTYVIAVLIYSAWKQKRLNKKLNLLSSVRSFKSRNISFQRDTTHLKENALTNQNKVFTERVVLSALSCWRQNLIFGEASNCTMPIRSFVEIGKKVQELKWETRRHAQLSRWSHRPSLFLKDET
jgi:hypothetical protein